MCTRQAWPAAGAPCRTDRQSPAAPASGGQAAEVFTCISGVDAAQPVKDLFTPAHITNHKDGTAVVVLALRCVFDV